MSRGTTIRRIIVIPYDPQWIEQYRAEAEAITNTLGPVLVAIHHIGSTAVPDLCAKPIIDIMAVISSHLWRDAHVEALQRQMYIFKGEYGIPRRHFFIKPGEEMRTHHLHIFPQDHTDIHRHLALRDYLRAFPEHARQYGFLKTALADSFPHDIEAYMAGKAGMIRELEEMALNWREDNKAGPVD